MPGLIANNIESLGGSIKPVKNIVAKVNSISDLLNIDTSKLDDKEQFHVLGFHEPNDGGGGIFYWDANEDRSNHNGGTIISPDAIFPSDWSDMNQQETWFTSGGTGNGCWKRVVGDYVTPEMFGAKGDGVTDDTEAIQRAINFYETLRGTVKLPPKDYLVYKQDGKSCAIELKSYVSIIGSGIGGGDNQLATRIILADNQDCDVLGNYAGTLYGLSGCKISNFVIDGNNSNNTSGNGIYISSIFSNTILENLKIKNVAEDGIHIDAASTPVWINEITIFRVGSNGIYIGGDHTQALNLLNTQVDNAGLSGSGAGIYINVGSGDLSQFMIINYRFEQNTSTDDAATDVGIVINTANESQISIIGAYAFSNATTANDFIKITGSSSPTLTLINVNAMDKYTNILNDTINGTVIQNSVPGISFFTYTANIQNVLKLYKSDLSHLGTLAVDATSRLRINHPDDGSDIGFIDIFQKQTNPLFTFNNIGGFWAKDKIKLGGSSETSPDIIIVFGSGSPEGVVTANPGSLYLNTDGGTGSTLYVKESGEGTDTGWVAK